MKLWLDDLRPAPQGYIWCHSVKEVIFMVKEFKNHITLIDCDHDLGDYSCDGGDGVKFLDWLEEKGYNYPIRLHTMNPVGRENMRAIIQKNGWKEVF